MFPAKHPLILPTQGYSSDECIVKDVDLRAFVIFSVTLDS